jgi:perosamine synthetase
MLAINGGQKIRENSFMSRPHIDDKEREYLNDCLDKKMFSRFIGSPVENFREYLSMSSDEAANLEDFWSVLGGPYTRKFEAEFARKHGVRYAVSTNSATSSLISAALACGIKAGDEVITTAFSFTASSTAFRIAGAKLVFADIDPELFCITAENIKKRITCKTKAVVVVHLLGNAGDISEIKKLCDQEGLLLIEDSAQALHSKKDGNYLGTFGDVGIFSFQETKNIMTGEGGMAITNDAEIAYKLRLVRNHGESMVFRGVDDHEIIESAVGYNFRLQEPLSAIGYAQAQKIEMLNGIRKNNYVYLNENLQKYEFLSLVRPTNDDGEFAPYCLGMTFKHANIHRNTFAQALREEGVPVSTGFSRLLNENPCTYEDISFTPIAKKVNDEQYLGFFQLGYPNTIDDMNDILEAVDKIARHFDELLKIDSKFRVKREYISGRI